jgi:hypothetical protein
MCSDLSLICNDAEYQYVSSAGMIFVNNVTKIFSDEKIVTSNSVSLTVAGGEGHKTVMLDGLREPTFRKWRLESLCRWGRYLEKKDKKEGPIFIDKIDDERLGPSDCKHMLTIGDYSVKLLKSARGRIYEIPPPISRKRGQK